LADLSYEDDDDENEEDLYILNSPKQLSNISFVAGSKFKQKKSILVDGYDFHYRIHQSNSKNTTAWYR
jgi:hypothetical protein